MERDNRPPTASVDAQVFADGALGRRLGDAWLDSPRRAEIMRRWAGAGLSDHALRCVFNSLAEAAARREIDAETLLNAIRNALGNTALSDSYKGRFIRMIGQLPEEARRSEQVFGFLLSLIEGSTSQTVKLNAAYAIGESIPLDAPKAAKLRAVADKLNGKEIAAVLREAAAKKK